MEIQIQLGLLFFYLYVQFER